MSATRQETFTNRFRLEVEPERDLARVCPVGEVDLATAPSVHARVQELASDGFTRVTLDLREVTFLDSSGLRMVLALCASAEADHWEFRVIEGPRDVQRVFELTGVAPMVPFVAAA
jgi:anti-sigma B factor antagonist